MKTTIFKKSDVKCFFERKNQFKTTSTFVHEVIIFDHPISKIVFSGIELGISIIDMNTFSLWKRIEIESGEDLCHLLKWDSDSFFFSYSNIIQHYTFSGNNSFEKKREIKQKLENLHEIRKLGKEEDNLKILCINYSNQISIVNFNDEKCKVFKMIGNDVYSSLVYKDLFYVTTTSENNERKSGYPVLLVNENEEIVRKFRNEKFCSRKFSYLESSYIYLNSKGEELYFGAESGNEFSSLFIFNSSIPDESKSLIFEIHFPGSYNGFIFLGHKYLCFFTSFHSKYSKITHSHSFKIFQVSEEFNPNEIKEIEVNFPVLESKYIKEEEKYRISFLRLISSNPNESEITLVGASEIDHDVYTVSKFKLTGLSISSLDNKFKLGMIDLQERIDFLISSQDLYSFHQKERKKMFFSISFPSSFSSKISIKNSLKILYLSQ